MVANVQFSVSAGTFDLRMRFLIDVCLVYATWQRYQATSNGLLA
jgi:hypothetical protein